MNGIEISVIVPVYNAERFLDRCINSILNQSFEGFELLLIDDGSTDGSGIICDNYAAKDERIKVFHKDNGGVSSARQFGIEHSSGTFIQFIDSDDWIEQNCLNDNYILAKELNADIVINNFFGGEKVVEQCFTGDLIEDLFLGNIMGNLWNKLFRLDKILASNIKFNHNLNFCEDFVFLCELWEKIPDLIITMNNKAYYHYCENSNSLTRKHSLSRIRNEEKYIKTIKAIIPSLSEEKIYINEVSVLLGYLCLGIYSFKKYKKLYPRLPVFRTKACLKVKILLFLSRNILFYNVIKLLFKVRRVLLVSV